MSWNVRFADKRPKFSDMTLMTDKTMSPLLHTLLTHALPHPHEEAIRGIIKKELKKYGLDTSAESTVFQQDDFGNLYVDLRKDKTHRTMFSCHMDTMHSSAGTIQVWSVNKGVKGHEEGTIYAGTTTPIYRIYDPDNPQKEVAIRKLLDREKIYHYELIIDTKIKCNDKVKLYVNKKMYANATESTRTDMWFWGKHVENGYNAEILGADDKVGIYICMKMIANKVPGLYVFHVGEERGCKGSRYILDKHPEVLKDIDACVAFDRMDYTHIIAHQHSARSASVIYTNALAMALNEGPIPPAMQYKGDVTGVFTDSGVYVDKVPECTNVSVGYFDQHTPSEHFDLVWLESFFIPSVLKVDWQKLPIMRNPIKEIVQTSHEEYDYGYTRHFGYENNLSSKRHDPLAPHLITAATGYHKCPKWEPEDGLMAGASEPAMVRIIEAHFDLDCYMNRSRAQDVYRLLKINDDLRTNYIALRKWAVANGGSKDEIDAIEDASADIDDPNGTLAPPKDVPFVSKTTTFCGVCHRELNRCICMPVRKHYTTDEEYQYDMDLWMNTAGVAVNLMRPDRSKFPDQVAFDVAMVTYQQDVAKASSKLIGVL